MALLANRKDMVGQIENRVVFELTPLIISGLGVNVLSYC